MEEYHDGEDGDDEKVLKVSEWQDLRDIFNVKEAATNAELADVINCLRMFIMGSPLKLVKQRDNGRIRLSYAEIIDPDTDDIAWDKLKDAERKDLLGCIRRMCSSLDRRFKIQENVNTGKIRVIEINIDETITAEMEIEGKRFKLNNKGRIIRTPEQRQAEITSLENKIEAFKRKHGPKVWAGTRFYKLKEMKMKLKQLQIEAIILAAWNEQREQPQLKGDEQGDKVG